MRLANCLSPIFAFMFDNTPVFEGVPSPLNMMRARIWDSVDAERSGMIEESIDKDDFGYLDYAKRMYGRPALMTHKDGKTEYTGDKKLSELFSDSHMTQEDIRYALGMFFPDVRVKDYIEIRMADSVPEPYMLGYAALIKGLFYNEQNTEKYLKIFAGKKAKDIQAMKHELYNRDKKAKVFRKNIYDFCAELCADAQNALGEEKTYLNALRYAMENKLKIYEATALETQEN
jgi:glutamate--cysteine ligase